MAALDNQSFNNVIRLVRRASIEDVNFLRDATFNQLRSLRVPRDMEYAATKTPKGSDQVDTASILAWIRSVEKDDPEAVKQLKGLDATLVARG